MDIAQKNTVISVVIYQGTALKTTINNDKLYIELELNEINPDILSYLSSLEITSKSKASTDGINMLSKEISSNW